MKLASATVGTRRRAVRIEDETAVLLPFDGVDDLLSTTGLEAQAAGQLVSRPAKILCVGQNYLAPIREMGRPIPEYATLFGKFANALIGPTDEIVLPPESTEVDWEAELAIVIGRTCRRATPDDAAEALAGYAVLNDISMRDWQFRTAQWLQGKTFERSTPIGPMLVTRDVFEGEPDLELTCEVNGEVVQSARTGDLRFGPAAIVSYISRFTTLVPGDVIATGTPGGVGAVREPKRLLKAGDVLRTAIGGIGTCLNPFIAEAT